MITQFHAQWDTGWLIWVVCLAVAAGLCWVTAACAGIWYLVTGRKDSYSMSVPTFGIAVVAALILGLIGTFVAFPFSGQYHRYVPETGVVTAIGSRFLASGVQNGGTDQKFVVTFANGATFGCLDTRCANVRDGDQLTLMCERSFQFNAPAPGWDCNWGQDIKPDGMVIP